MDSILADQIIKPFIKYPIIFTIIPLLEFQPDFIDFDSISSILQFPMNSTELFTILPSFPWSKFPSFYYSKTYSIDPYTIWKLANSVYYFQFDVFIRQNSNLRFDSQV